MADLSDVSAALAQLAATACYPNGTGQPSVSGKIIAIGEGWPKPADLDATIAASPPGAFVTVFPLPGATALSDQLFEAPRVVVQAVKGLSASISGAVVTASGTAGIDEYITIVVDRTHRYSHVSAVAESADVVAGALASVIAADYPGTSAVGGVLTIVGAYDVEARVGAPVTMGRLIHRQKQQYRIATFAPNPTDRTAIGKAIDVAFKQNLVLTMADTSQAIMTYMSSMHDDNSENNGIYRRDLVFAVEYGTMETWTAYEVTAVATNMEIQIEAPVSITASMVN